MMKQTLHHRSARWLLPALAALAFAVPASAQEQDASVAEIEQLIDGSQSIETALETANGQIAASDVSGAATTLERALIIDPASVPARARYAAVLCMLDDRQAANAEIGKMTGQEIDDGSWSGVEAACGPVAKPSN